MSSRALFNEFLELDWTKKHYIILLTLIFLISRILLLNSSFGSDGDVWRVAVSSLNIHYHFVYIPSRFPGFPFTEFLNSLVINYGWIATNSLTMIISLISVIVLAYILKELKIKNKGLIVFTYMFIPIIWINTVSTMDYMFALCFILLAWYFVIKNNYPNNYIIAGIFLGLAVSSRLTSIIFLIPFIYLIFNQKHNLKQIAFFIIFTAIISMIFFAPVYLQYGFNFLSFYPSKFNFFLFLEDMNYNFGLLALFFGFLVFILSLKKFYSCIKQDIIIQFSLIIIILYIILFVKTPYDVGYLLPIIPFILILMSKIAYRKFFIIFCIFLMLNSFISINFNGNIIDEGTVIQDNKYNNDFESLIQNLSYNGPGNAVIISGNYAPAFYYFNHINNKNIDDINHYWTNNNTLYVDLLNLTEIKELQNKGYTVYYVSSETRNLLISKYGFNPNEYNCSDLFSYK